MVEDSYAGVTREWVYQRQVLKSVKNDKIYEVIMYNVDGANHYNCMQPLCQEDISYGFDLSD